MANAIRRINVEEAFRSYTGRKELQVTLNDGPLINGRVTELYFVEDELSGLEIVTHQGESCWEKDDVKVYLCPVTRLAICESRECELHYTNAPVLVEDEDAADLANGESRLISGPATAFEEVPGQRYQHVDEILFGSSEN